MDGRAAAGDTHLEASLPHPPTSSTHRHPPTQVAGAHWFVDILVDTTVRFGGEPPGLTGYEKATAVFLLLQVALAACATALAMRAVDEIKAKNREEYSRLTTTTLNDTLQFEPDRV